MDDSSSIKNMPFPRWFKVNPAQPDGQSGPCRFAAGKTRGVGFYYLHFLKFTKDRLSTGQDSFHVILWRIHGTWLLNHIPFSFHDAVNAAIQIREIGLRKLPKEPLKFILKGFQVVPFLMIFIIK
jgi:hypothetical protein